MTVFTHCDSSSLPTTSLATEIDKPLGLWWLWGWILWVGVMGWWDGALGRNSLVGVWGGHRGYCTTPVQPRHACHHSPAVARRGQPPPSSSPRTSPPTLSCTHPHPHARHTHIPPTPPQPAVDHKFSPDHKTSPPTPRHQSSHITHPSPSPNTHMHWPSSATCLPSTHCQMALPAPSSC